MQPLDSRGSVSSPNSIVPFRNQISKRASLMAKRHTAVHAATSLSFNNTSLASFINFFPVHYSNFNRPALGDLAIINL
jgi:hypothetical protein